jgi:arginine deiminase
MGNFGVHSEVGRLRKVMVHRPDLSLTRLTPSNHDELLFDDVLWVERAQLEHDQFVRVLRDRGIEVYYLQDLLGEALAASQEARTGLIEAVVDESTVGWALVDELRSMLAAVPADVLAKHLIGGLTIRELDPDWRRYKNVSLIAAGLEDDDTFVLPPLPNSLFTRDSSAWIYGGVSVNPMYWPARRRESLNLLTVYRYHPMFQPQSEWRLWFPETDGGNGSPMNVDVFGRASLEGGDVLPIGHGTVLIGLSERTTGRMIERLAATLFHEEAAERVIVALMTKDRAHMHLDTVFTMLDRDTVTAYPGVVNGLRAISLRPSTSPGDFNVTVEKDLLSAVADALHVKRLNVVETGGDRYQAEREQWDDANNTIALEPGVVVTYERNTFTIAKMRQAGIEVLPIAGFELGKGRGGGHCMTCPFERDGI